MNKKISTKIAVGVVVLTVLIVGSVIWHSGKNNIQMPQTNSISVAPDQNEKNCVKLGEAGPNGSLGPNDPNRRKICCNGLTQKSPARCSTESNSQGGCNSMEGCGTICLQCGDHKCDSKYENKCNCPEDCK